MRIFMDFLQSSSNYLISGQCSGWSWWIHVFTHRTPIMTDETRKVVVDCMDYMTMWPYLLVSMVCSQFLALEVGPFLRDHPGIPRCAFACLCSCVSEKKENERRLRKALGNIRLSLLVSCWWHVLREKRCETHSSPNEHVRRRSTRNSWMVCMDSGAISASRGAPLGAMILEFLGENFCTSMMDDDGWWMMMDDDGWWMQSHLVHWDLLSLLSLLNWPTLFIRHCWGWSATCTLHGSRQVDNCPLGWWQVDNWVLWLEPPEIQDGNKRNDTP